MHITKRSAAIATATVLAVTGGGAAYAYWTAGGTGTGEVTTSAGVDALTAVQTTTITNLAPGIAPQVLSGTFTNPNASPVYVTSITASITGVVDALGDPIVGCSAADYAIASATMAVGAEALVDDTSTWTGATIVFVNSLANQDACKSAVVEIGYVIV